MAQRMQGAPCGSCSGVRHPEQLISIIILPADLGAALALPVSAGGGDASRREETGRRGAGRGGFVGPVVWRLGGGGFGLRVSAWLFLLSRWEKRRAQRPKIAAPARFRFPFPSCLRMMTSSLTNPGPAAAVDCAIDARQSEQVLLRN